MHKDQEAPSLNICSWNPKTRIWTETPAPEKSTRPVKFAAANWWPRACARRCNLATP
jgi:hypothetical protein